MGIKELKRAGDKIAFEADVRVANVGRKTATFDTREMAEKFFASTTAAAQKALRASASKVIQEVAVGGQRNFERAKLADVIVAFCGSSACSPRAKSSLVRVAEYVGKITVGKADEDWSQNYLRQMRRRLSRHGRPFALATIKEHLDYLKVVCRWWARRNKVGNPFIGLSTQCMPSDWQNKRKRRLEAGEYARILSQINMLPTRQAHWRCLLTLALETCARQQELVLAHWSELSREDQLWTIPAAHTKKKNQRSVPLSPLARAAIDELRSLRQDGDQRIFEVFRNPAVVCQGFRNIVKMANISDLRYHDLRHEGISRRVLKSPPKNLPAIMEIVGHKDYESLMRYSHLLDDDIIGLFD